MAKTQDQVKHRALQILGAVGAGQPMTNEDADVLDVLAVAKRLDAERIIDLLAHVDSNDIPDEYFIALSEVVAADYAPVYGMGIADASALQAKGQATIANIVRRTRPIVQAMIPKVSGW